MSTNGKHNGNGLWQSKIVGHGRVAPDQLVANPFNFRTHPIKQREALAAAIAEVGFLRSVTVNQRTGNLVDGHERVWQALQSEPVECMARPIRNHGGKDDDVYDPFVGSGTTIIAAEQLGRRSYCLEVDPAYCDVCVQRWENLTGGKAKR